MSGTSAEARPTARGVTGALAAFFSGWRFPAWTVAILTAHLVTLGVALLLPTGDDAVGRFAEEFKTWCFGFDPATGRMEWMLVAMMLFEPFGLALMIAAIWRRQLAEAFTGRRWVAPVLSSMVAVIAAGVVFGLLHDPRAPSGALPFPGERLRTALTPPPMSLTDQEGREVSLEALRGRVVLVTSVYSRCSQTCPMIMAQVKRALAGLSEAERANLTVLAVSLDPAHDRPDVLARLAKAQGISAPLYRLGTGEPAYVEGLLDALGVARSRDPQTGIISHANLFWLMDREGRLAYRFTLGERQEEWLGAALKLLVAEVGGVG
jgi:protein SCO1